MTASENEILEHHDTVKLISTKNVVMDYEKEKNLDYFEAPKLIPKKIWLIIATLAIFCASMIVVLIFIACQKSEKIVKVFNNVRR